MNTELRTFFRCTREKNDVCDHGLTGRDHGFRSVPCDPAGKASESGARRLAPAAPAAADRCRSRFRSRGACRPQPAVLSVEGRIGIPQAPRRTVSRTTRLSLASTCRVSSTGRSKMPKLPWATTAVASSGGRAATRAASVTMAERAAASVVSPTIRSMPSAIRVSRAKAPSVARGSGSFRTAEKPKAARPAVAALPTEVPIETSLCNIRANENEGPKTLASWHEPALFPRPASTPSNRDPAAPRAGTCPPRRAARRARRPP